MKIKTLPQFRVPHSKHLSEKKKFLCSSLIVDSFILLCSWFIGLLVWRHAALKGRCVYGMKQRCCIAGVWRSELFQQTSVLWWNQWNAAGSTGHTGNSVVCTDSQVQWGKWKRGHVHWMRILYIFRWLVLCKQLKNKYIRFTEIWNPNIVKSMKYTMFDKGFIQIMLSHSTYWS